MRKSSKAVSLLLAGLMTASCFSVATVSAANVDSNATGVMTADERIAAGHQLIFFQFPKTAWGDVKNVKVNTKKSTTNVFCNVYAIWNNKTEFKTRSWEAASTSCLTDDVNTGVFYYDITESGQGTVEEGAEYGVLFSTKANAGQSDLLQPNTDGFQTCDIYFNPDCVGDTVVLEDPAEVRENTANSQKIDYKAHWKNHPECGSMKKVSTFCMLIDGMFVPTEPHAKPVAEALQSYLANPTNSSSFMTSRLLKICEQFETTPEEVRDFYADYYADKLVETEYTEEDPDADADHPKEIKIYKYEHVDGVDDLKSDGTLKDEFRKYVQETTTWSYSKKDKKWSPSVASVNYPTLDIVCERLAVDMPSEEETTEAPVEETTEAPVEETTEVPVEETTEAPVEETTEAPIEETTEAPVEETTAAPVEETTEAPVEETTEAPVEETTEAPVEETTEAPVEETTEAPVEETTEAPVEETTEAPVEETTEAPVEETTEAPVEETTEAPASEDVVIAAGSPAEIFGTAWDGVNEVNTMTKNGDVYTKTYTVDKAYKAVQVKAVVNGITWVGDENDQNVTFNLTGAGEFTVTYDPTVEGAKGTGLVTVTGDIVEFATEFTYETVFAVGNGEGNWLNGASWDPAFIDNEMSKVAENVWEIEFNEVPEGFGRQIKFAVDGAWTHNFGIGEGVEFVANETTDAAYNGNNITFDTDSVCSIKAQLDLREFDFGTKTGAKFTITVTPEEEEDTTAAPAEDTTAAPAEDTTAAPAEDTTAAPAEDTTAAPAEETTAAPAEDTTAAPAEDTTAAPASEDVVIAAGSPAEIFGTAWDGVNEVNTMTKNGDVYTKTYTVDKAYKAVQVKAVVNGITWVGDENDQNVTFNLTGAGEFTVTYDPTVEGAKGTGLVTVTGDIVEFATEFTYETVFAVGNGEGNWLNGASWDPAFIDNEMSKVAENVWEIEFNEVPEGFGRQIKFAVDGAWTHNFGIGEGVEFVANETTDAAYNGNNITFDTDSVCSIKAQLDLREFDFGTKTGAKFTITVTPEEEEDTTAAPAEDTTAAPAEDTTAAPAEDTTAAPAEDTTAAPAEETTAAPAEDTTAAPAEDTTAAPAEETTEAPVDVTGIMGDVDGNNVVTIDDATSIQRASIELEKFNETQTKLADTNGDGRVSILDVTAIQAYLAQIYAAAGNTNAKLLADGTIVPAN